MTKQSKDLVLYLNERKAKEYRKIIFHKEVKINFKGKAVLINEDKKERDPNHEIEISDNYILNRSGNYKIIYTDLEEKVHIFYFSIRKKIPIFVFLLLFLPVLLLSSFLPNRIINDSIEKELSIAVSNVNDTEKTPSYVFHLYLDQENENTGKSINLIDTVARENQINYKIAPGAKGKFNIIMDTYNSTKDLGYEIKVKDKTQKPRNLCFKGKNKKEYSSLEELATEELKGKILKNSQEVITIQWEWKYQIDDVNDQIDTKNATQIAKYEFEVLAIGKEI